MSNRNLVYSTDPRENQRCPQCKELVSQCRCVAERPVMPGSFTAVLRIEKAGRGGKTVTVIDRLPKAPTYLKELATRLKTRCAAGGTHTIGKEAGRIEIQGDKRDVIRDLLDKEGIPHKG